VPIEQVLYVELMHLVEQTIYLNKLVANLVAVTIKWFIQLCTLIPLTKLV